MPTDSTKPTWIEPPPPKPAASGCFTKGCLVLVVCAGLAFLIFRGGELSRLFSVDQNRPSCRLKKFHRPNRRRQATRRSVPGAASRARACSHRGACGRRPGCDSHTSALDLRPGASARPDRGRDQRFDFRQQEITRACLCLAQRKHRPCPDQHFFRQSAGFSARLFEWQLHDHDERPDSD